MMSACVTGLALAATLVSVRPAAAQSTIMNIPTTDTAAPTKVYFEFDFLTQMPRAEDFAWTTYVPRVVIGATDKVEVGVNYAIGTYADDGDNPYTTFQPNIKVKLFNDDDKGLAVAAGLIGYIPNKDGDKFGQVYGVVSKKIASGARFHFGGYGAISGDFEDKGGAIVGYEQPLGGRASFVFDMLTGNNFWGYLTPAISIALPHSALFNIGYSIGWNEITGDGDPDYRNNALFAYYGIVLN
jgi:hypothetical protein